MDIIKDNLENVKSYILSDFVEILPDESLSKFLLGPSKMIRSTLALLFILAQNFNLNEKIYNILAAGEIIHNASLLHDDVIDKADTRRGELTLSKKYSPAISILSGDYLLAKAFRHLSQTSDDVIEIFQKTSQNMVEAEIKQFLTRGQKLSKEEYISICKGKTASLFSAVLECCALTLGVNKSEFREFGLLFGITFQIKNDLDFNSVLIDKKNKIYTAKDILGIEKTAQLLDNYKEDMGNLIRYFPENIYKEALEGLIKNLCTIEKN